MEDSTVTLRTFQFGEHAIQCMCRRDHEESAGVTLTLQMTVEEVWESFWDFGGGSCTKQQQDEKAKPEVQQQEQERQQHTPAAGGGESSSAATSGEKTELLGLDVWPAAIRLCEYLSSHPHLVVGVDVAELGAGMGLPGLLCAKLGARHVLSSDYVHEVVQHMQRNGELNGLQPPAFTAMRLDWTQLGALQAQQLRSFRLLLLADVLYQSQLIAPLVNAINALLHPQGIILLGHLPRRAIIRGEDGLPTLVDDDQPYNIFRAAVQRAGLHTRVLSDGKPAPEVQDGSSEPKQGPLLLAFALDSELLASLPPVLS